MTALTGTNASPAFVHANTDHLLAPSERRTPTPHLVVGLALGSVGALLVAIGGIGLPVALVSVESRNVITPEQRPALDAALRLAPVLFLVGVAHLIAAAGLVAANSWGRRVGMTVAGTVASVGVAGMVATAGRLDPFATVNTQNAATAAADGISILGFIVVAYAAAFVTLLVSNRR